MITLLGELFADLFVLLTAIYFQLVIKGKIKVSDKHKLIWLENLKESKKKFVRFNIITIGLIVLFSLIVIDKVIDLINIL